MRFCLDYIRGDDVMMEVSCSYMDTGHYYYYYYKNVKTEQNKI